MILCLSVKMHTRRPSPPSPSSSSSSSIPSYSSVPIPGSSCSDDGSFFLHPVSNLDTLAGLAIKYGVEVADIKKANGLVTDLQMFGHHILRIPKPGGRFLLQKAHRHKVASPAGSSKEKRNAPSPSHVQSSNNRHQDSKTFSSATTNIFRGFALSSSTRRISSDEGMEMTCYNLDGRVNISSEFDHTPDGRPHISGAQLSPLITMEDECGLLNERITGIREENEENSGSHDVYTPIVRSVFNSVVGVEKNSNKTSLSRRSKINELNQANSSKIEIREAIFSPAKWMQTSTKNRTSTNDNTSGNDSFNGSTICGKISVSRRSEVNELNQANSSKIEIREGNFSSVKGMQTSSKNRINTNDKISGNDSLDSSTYLLHPLYQDGFCRKEALPSNTNVKDILPSNVIKSISTTNLQDQNNEVSSLGSIHGSKYDVKSQPISSSLLDSKSIVCYHKPALD